MDETNVSQTRDEARLIYAIQLAEKELEEFMEYPRPNLAKMKDDIAKAREDYRDNPTEEYKNNVMELERDYLDSKIQIIGLEKKQKSLEAKVTMAKQKLNLYRNNH